MIRKWYVMNVLSDACVVHAIRLYTTLNNLGEGWHT